MKANKHNNIDDLIINNDERIKNLLEAFIAISPESCHVAEYQRDAVRLQVIMARYFAMLEDSEKKDLVANQEFLLETLERDIEKYTRKEEEH